MNCARSSRTNGFSYLELLVALSIAAMIFGPAFRFAVSVRTTAHAAEATPGADDALARDLRCAVDDPNGPPFHFHDGVLKFSRISASGPVTVRYTEGRYRFLDGETWREEWGWDSSSNRPVRGIRGLPLAVEVRTNADVRVLPVMVTLLNRLSP